jgi:hypothetical protein
MPCEYKKIASYLNVLQNSEEYFLPTSQFYDVKTLYSDKPEQIATKAPRHQAKPLVNIHLCAFVSWWRKCFAIKCAQFTIKTLRHLL